jgi:hypothetical protein
MLMANEAINKINKIYDRIGQRVSDVGKAQYARNLKAHNEGKEIPFNKIIGTYDENHKLADYSASDAIRAMLSDTETGNISKMRVAGAAAIGAGGIAAVDVAGNFLFNDRD